MLNNSREVIDVPGILHRSISESIIKTLLYFDIFNYPLKKEEILRFLGERSSIHPVSNALDLLVKKEFIFQFDDFFSIQNKQENILRRIKGNEMALQLLPMARKRAELIASFPFVKAVLGSGSLSKDYMDENSDLDFFIITEPGRLWIARMMLVLYKRLFLQNSHKYFCVNYFISSDKLEIEEKNQFTATELATVIPLYNHGMYSELLGSNGWLMRFFPNFNPRPTSLKQERNLRVKKFVERCINIFGASYIDEWCMRTTYNRWVKMYKDQYSPADFKIAFKTRKYTSKTHPKHYQKKVTDILEQKWKAYSDQNNLDGI